MIIIKTHFAQKLSAVVLKNLWGISESKCRLHPLRKKGNKASEPEVALPRHGGKKSN